MKRQTVTFALIALLFTITATAAADRSETVKFKAGASNAARSGMIKGRDGANYLLGANAGQIMQVLFTPSNNSCYFNVIGPGGSEAIFNGSINGNEFSANLTESGTFTVQVYLMRNAARRNETCKYKISFELTG